MRRSGSIIAMLCLLFPMAALAQHGGRHGTSTPTSATTTPTEDPDMATFKHAIAVQATEAQTAQFGLMIRNTANCAAAGTRSSDPVIEHHRFHRTDPQGYGLARRAGRGADSES